MKKVDRDHQKEVGLLAKELEMWRDYYFSLADAVARDSNSVDHLCEIARVTRYQRNDLRDVVKDLLDLIDEHGSPVMKAHATRLLIARRMLNRVGEELRGLGVE